MYSWENLSTESNYRGDMDAEKRQYHAAKSFVTVGKMTKGNEKKWFLKIRKMIFRQKSAIPKLQMTALWLRFPKFKTEKRKANYFQ